MHNMIKLDWMGMKCYQKRVILLPLMVVVYGLLSEALIIPLMAFMACSFSVNPFAVEEKGKLDHLYLTLPVTRESIVNARFTLSLIMQFMGLIFGTVVTVLYSRLFYGHRLIFMHSFRADLGTMSLILCASLLGYAIMNLSIFPLLFKIGYAKGKGIGFYMPIAVMLVVGYALFILWQFNGAFKAWTNAFMAWAVSYPMRVSAMILAMAIVALAASYMLSHRVYAKREF